MTVDPNTPVHPTFLYESVWCLLSFLVLHLVVTYFRKFKGEVFMMYGVLYGLERMIVEGMRTDSLYIGSTNIRVSQVLSGVIAVVALAVLVYFFVKLKQNKLPKALVLDNLDELEDINKIEREKSKQEKAQRAEKRKARKNSKENK